MSERCPQCGREFANTKALGSHIHYLHSAASSAKVRVRNRAETERFSRLLEICLSGSGLALPGSLGKLEKALAEIPEGISPLLDRFRRAYVQALAKETLLLEAEHLLVDSSQSVAPPAAGVPLSDILPLGDCAE